MSVRADDDGQEEDDDKEEDDGKEEDDDKEDDDKGLLFIAATSSIVLSNSIISLVKLVLPQSGSFCFIFSIFLLISFFLTEHVVNI